MDDITATIIQAIAHELSTHFPTIVIHPKTYSITITNNIQITDETIAKITLPTDPNHPTTLTIWRHGHPDAVQIDIADPQLMDTIITTIKLYINTYRPPLR